ncbi:MAG: hypothetical protein Kow0020_13670 [Wenzhouxiangellaceae bacterium]
MSFPIRNNCIRLLRYRAGSIVPGVIAVVTLAAASMTWASGTREYAAQMIATPAGPGALAPGLAASENPDTPVLSWVEPHESGHALKFARFLGEDFGPAHTVASGSDWFVNWADRPGVFPGPGIWLAHWLQKNGSDVYAYEIRMAMSADQGRSWTPIGTPHDDGTPTEHGFVSYLRESDRRVGIAWLDGRYSQAADHTPPAGHGHAHGAMTLRYASWTVDQGFSRSIELDERNCDCCPTSAAMSPDGPVIAYRDRSIGEIRDIAVVRRVGDRWSRPRVVHDDHWQIAGCPVNGPSLAADGSQMALAWFTMASGQARVQIAFSDDGGQNFGAPRTFGEGRALGRTALIRHQGHWVLGWMEESGNTAVLNVAVFTTEGGLVAQGEITRLDGGRISGVPQMASAGHAVLVAWTGRSDDRGQTTTRIQAALFNPLPNMR